MIDTALDYPTPEDPLEIGIASNGDAVVRLSLPRTMALMLSIGPLVAAALWFYFMGGTGFFQVGDDEPDLFSIVFMAVFSLPIIIGPLFALWSFNQYRNPKFLVVSKEGIAVVRLSTSQGRARVLHEYLRSRASSLVIKTSNSGRQTTYSLSLEITGAKAIKGFANCAILNALLPMARKLAAHIGVQLEGDPAEADGHDEER